MAAVGEVFAGRYELVDPLGEGGVGVVWRAWDRRAECYVAAKVLRQVDATSLLRFVREQSLRIDHRHIVMPLGWAGDDDRVLFTMPLVRGGSVATLIGDYGPLPASWAAALLDQLLSALEVIHAAGLVHRDVKPANLLLEPTGEGPPQLRLSDFGIATPVDLPRLTHADIVLGTSGYVAPEALAGADPAPAHDLYSAGMTALEMLTGARPPRDVRAEELVAALGEPAALSEVVRGLVQTDPARRPESATKARALLAATGLVPPAGVAPDDDELQIEIFDQLPPLPPGWTDEPVEVPPPPEPVPPPPPPSMAEAEPVAAVEPAEVEPVVVAPPTSPLPPRVVTTPQPDETDANASAAVETADADETADGIEPAASRRSRRGPVGSLAIGVVGCVLLAVALIRLFAS